MGIMSSSYALCARNQVSRQVHASPFPPTLPHAVTCIRTTSPRSHTSNVTRWKSNAAFVRQKRAVGNRTERNFGKCVSIIMNYFNNLKHE
jgi:hypothetical protein